MHFFYIKIQYTSTPDATFPPTLLLAAAAPAALVMASSSSASSSSCSSSSSISSCTTPVDRRFGFFRRALEEAGLLELDGFSPGAAEEEEEVSAKKRKQTTGNRKGVRKRSSVSGGSCFRFGLLQVRDIEGITPLEEEVSELVVVEEESAAAAARADGFLSAARALLPLCSEDVGTWWEMSSSSRRNWERAGREGEEGGHGKVNNLGGE